MLKRICKLGKEIAKELTISFGQVIFRDGILDLSNLKDSNVKNIEFIKKYYTNMK